MSGTVYRANETGVGMRGAEGDRMTNVVFYEENGSVILRVELNVSHVVQTEALQYLTASQAMAFSVALRRLAVITLEKEAEHIR